MCRFARPSTVFRRTPEGRAVPEQKHETTTDDVLVEGEGSAWPPAPETPPPSPEWVNGRAFPAVWRESLTFTVGGLVASQRQFPQLRPGAPWRHRPDPESETDVEQAIAAKLEIGLHSLPLLARAEVVLVEPGLVSAMPEWGEEEEAVYAAEARLPSSPLFIDCESEDGMPAAWEAETWPRPFHLRGALCWAQDEMLCLIPYGSVDGIHPFGGNDYQAWARWIYLQGHSQSWPMPGAGDFIGRPTGELLAWVDAEAESACSQQGRVAYNLAKRSLMVLLALEKMGGEFVEPRLPRSLRRRAHRQGHKIARVPRDFPSLRAAVADPTAEPSRQLATEECVVPSTHARLEQAHALWHEALDAYQEPEEFVTKLNALISTLRTITLVLQKEFGNSDEFKGWYGPWQEVMDDDYRLQWAVKARNEIQKEGDLATHSRARVRIVGDWLTDTAVDIEVDPTADAKELARRLLVPGLPKWVRDDGILEVERRWTVAELAEDELLDALAHCYGVLAQVVAEAHSRRGGDARNCELSADQTCGNRGYSVHPSGRLRCMVATREARTSRRELATGRPFSLETRTVTVSRDNLVDEEITNHYLFDEWQPPAKGATFKEHGASMHEIAKRILAVDGYHLTQLWLFNETDEVGQNVLYPEDQRDKYMMIQAAAEEADRLGADRILFTTEAWWAPKVPAVDLRYPLRAGEREDRQEMISTYALARGELCHIWHTLFTRAENGIQHAETDYQQAPVPNFLQPFIRVWALWPSEG